MTREKVGSDGQIITFYSYKGGTGRSMALANVAWILASNGKRVLAIDWDLEAPGLHEYFGPFLSEDPNLESSDGLLDMMVSYARQAIDLEVLPEDLEWYDEHSNYSRYAIPLDWRFSSDGRLDFLPAGRQSTAYASRMNRFDWIAFYERLGGQRFFEAFRNAIRRDYDYVLVDSRTGVSDTAGICTIQLPDALVVCFTPNRQGIRGAREVAAAVNAQRQASGSEREIRIFPVPMRLDNAEKQALDDSVEEIRHRFGKFLGHLSETERAEYWRRISVPYIPFYAYGEMLAPLADQPSASLSLLEPMSTLTRYTRAA